MESKIYKTATDEPNYWKRIITTPDHMMSITLIGKLIILLTLQTNY